MFYTFISHAISIHLYKCRICILSKFMNWNETTNHTAKIHLNETILLTKFAETPSHILQALLLPALFIACISSVHFTVILSWPTRSFNTSWVPYVWAIYIPIILFPNITEHHWWISTSEGKGDPETSGCKRASSLVRPAAASWAPARVPSSCRHCCSRLVCLHQVLVDADGHREGLLWASTQQLPFHISGMFRFFRLLNRKFNANLHVNAPEM